MPHWPTYMSATHRLRVVQIGVCRRNKRGLSAQTCASVALLAMSDAQSMAKYHEPDGWRTATKEAAVYEMEG